MTVLLSPREAELTRFFSYNDQFSISAFAEERVTRYEEAKNNSKSLSSINPLSSAY